MRKRLLLAALAMVSAVSSFAFEVGEYAYTATQRLKVTGENTVQNSTFAEGLNVGGWCGLTAIEEVSATTWKVTDGEGPNGEAVLQSQGATADEPICNVWSGLYGGQTYIVSFMIKGESAATSTVGTTVGSNYMDFFLNADGSLTHAASTDEAPVVNVATAFNITTEWQTVSFVFTPDEGQQLVMHFEKLATGTMITNFSINTVMEVYDDRIARRKVDFADKILADANFNTDAAATAREDFVGGVYDYIVKGLNGDPEGCDFDDIGNADQMMQSFDEGLTAFMDASSTRMNDQLNGIDFPSLITWNNGDTNGPSRYTNLKLEGGRWAHRANSDEVPDFIDYINAAIQGNYDLGEHRLSFVNEYFPAGKYYISAEVRVASCPSNAWTFNFNQTRDDAELFIGNGVYRIGEIAAGPNTKKVYMVGEIAEGEAFSAGVFFPAKTGNGAVFVKNVEIRSFGDLQDIIDRKMKWSTFIAQWNAAVNNRNRVIEMQSDNNYRWEKDSLQRALDQWDPYYNEVISKGWVTADGEDAGVATNEELEDWAKYNGVELYDADGNLLQYQVVRGYQYAINYVVTQNQAFANLKAEIETAKGIRDDDMNQGGDKKTFQAAIDAAQGVLDNMMANSTDATREADEAAIIQAIETLKAAEETFVNSVPDLVPIVSIDFSKGVEAVYTEATDETESTLSGFVTKGEAGQMDFILSGFSYNEEEKTYSTTTATTYAMGWLSGEELLFPDVLRVGNTAGTVNLPEAVTDDDVLRVQFDLYVGNLNKCFLNIQLQNAAGERVAGFNINRYNGTVEYNDFNNDANEGLDLLKYVTGVGSSKASNDAIYVESNKSSFDLIVDYKAQTIQGTVVNGKNGTCTGALMPLSKLDDNKITKFVLSSNYNNADRRCWFDNLVIYKYASTASGVNESVGIAGVKSQNVATGAIYTLSGVQVKGVPAKGLYIKDGKKFVIK